ncbi:endonuclease/exonuclease/phosphatase family protein [Dysgonomonas macrotermitis]|uniref:Endonuclease/Exonuclease/phosphatase family protein n=1 Tax=Dysgonomonas macrotermitis TaxID=1346286 RepID=A0A1M4WA64_9BACT|nr:endonuclease/exonuclease/phosphatase family protein [Dysgonomonas macrotermitis]SHE78050.1 Endonuclease/Exonuclease/phosphatase family protein [Dysgonomonas macrotermitis]
MKRTILIYICIHCLFSLNIFAQKKLGVYSVAFYNLENLYDTENDPLTNDEEFTPKGSMQWTDEKYQKKLENMASVISKLGREYCPGGPIAIGVSEIENRKVLEDLINTGALTEMGLDIIHYDSPDRRGVDVALLYNPKLFQVTSSKAYPYILPGDATFKTRDVLLASGTLAGESFHILVNHWPSRRGEKSSELREFAAAINIHIADSIYKANPLAKIVIMGDLNDDPTNKSCQRVLNAKKNRDEVKPGGLFNTMWTFYDKGIGSLSYKGQWNLFDQIIISESLLGKDYSSLKYWKSQIFNSDFLIQKEGKNKGYPLRTFSEGKFINGYSDHFPVLIYIVKNL